MMSIIKAASDTDIPHRKPLQLLSSVNTSGIYKDHSGNNVSSRKRLHQQSKKPQYQLLTTCFPVVNILQDSLKLRKKSSVQLPTVPNQAGTFIHRLLNEFFSITNINQNKSRLKQRRKRSKKDDCLICRKYRNHFSSDSCQLPPIQNSNAATRFSPDEIVPSMEKRRSLTDSQCQIIASAVELIFHTLLSNCR
ncbi:unnamed protein product [Adineta ricciae]|uniref:Uncharacterized protein n=1 Tax=Adineta ricciae TaxID=249248 RepID=A0A814GWN6_ADIRI|nr:unnamed protein product [Adineta ricciae]